MRCLRFILAALVAVGGAQFAQPPANCWGAEPAPAGVQVVETLESESADWDEVACEPLDCQPAEAGPAWPRTWELGECITLRMRGRIDTDAIWSQQSAANEATFGDLGDVVGLRRARIGVEGDLGSDGRYVSEIDLASGSVVPRDMYFAFGKRKEWGETQVGHFREPFSLEGDTSARFFAFMERSPINLLDPARSWGVGLFRETLDGNSTLAVGVFQAGTGAWDFQGGEGATVGITSRLTTAPINEGDGERLLHFGLALSERIPEDGVIVINQKPQSPLLEFGDSSTSPFVRVIRIPASFQQLINLQFATANGPLWAQAEWYGTFIDQTGGAPVFYRGCYVDGGYFVTGEHRKYNEASGTLGSIRVHRPFVRGPCECDRPLGWGAWELTARFAYLNFDDPDTPPGPNGQPIGTRMPQATAGMNWYWSDRMRLMFNYTYSLPDEISTGTSAASIFATRLAVFW